MLLYITISLTEFRFRFVLRIKVLYIISNDISTFGDWTVEKLMSKHRSRPHNPDIAGTFYRAGYIELGALYTKNNRRMQGKRKS